MLTSITMSALVLLVLAHLTCGFSHCNLKITLLKCWEESCVETVDQYRFTKCINSGRKGYEAGWFVNISMAF